MILAAQDRLPGTGDRRAAGETIGNATHPRMAVGISRGALIDLQWFAAEDEGRTKDPTETKLRKAREEGRIPKSQELNAALVMLVAVLVLILLMPWIFRNCAEMMRYFFSRAAVYTLGERGNAEGMLYYLVKLFLPVALSALVTGIAANLIQNRGFIFTWKPLEPNFGKIVPKLGQYFKKTVFSAEGAWNVVKSVIKVAILALISYAVIQGDIRKLLSLTTVNAWTALSHVAWMAAKLLVISAVFFLVIAIPDYFVQRHQFMEQMKMSEQEMKEEFKQEEGDPQVKGRIMQQMQALLRQNIPKNVAESTVVITNPTHYAVALKYVPEEMEGPMVTAKGVDALAARIRQIARDNGVPLVENRPLARALFAASEVGEVIPQQYYSAVAIVLAGVQRAAAGAAP